MPQPKPHAKTSARKDLLEHVGFLRLRMQRSIRLIAEQKLGKAYSIKLTQMLDEILIIEKELEIATLDRIWKGKI